VRCDDFQDAAAFLRNGGERGRQLSLLTAGTYRITRPSSSGHRRQRGEARHRSGAAPVVPAGLPRRSDRHRAGRRPIAAGDLAGPGVDGHDGFQRAQRFIEAGGSRGLQEEVLLSGTWNLNPWFVSVEPIPMTEIPIGYVEWW